MHNIREIRRPYLIAGLLVLGTVIAIAVFSTNTFVRGFVGDVLSVGLVYCLLKIFLKISMIRAVLISVLFAYFIEFMQLLGWTDRISNDSPWLQILLGSHFDVLDLIAYTLGGVLIFVFERLTLSIKKLLFVT